MAVSRTKMVSIITRDEAFFCMFELLSKSAGYWPGHCLLTYHIDSLLSRKKLANGNGFV
jgi:hypothetical protein